MKTRIAKQFRKPKGFLGHIVVFIMKKMNTPIYPKLIDRLEICDDDKILEIGYGTGDTIKIIGQQNKKCEIFGIDFSEMMYKKAGKTNRALLKSDRLTLLFGDFLKYDFKQSLFTKIFCINVTYFWDDLKEGFSKVYKVLDSGGIYGIYMASAEEMVKLKFTQSDVFNKYSIEFVKSCLEEVGFKDIQIFIESVNLNNAYFIYARK